MVTEFSDIKSGAKSRYITVTMAVEDGHERAGALCWQNLMVEGKGAGIFLDFLEKCTGEQYDLEEYKEEGLDLDTDELIGTELTVVIKQHEYPEGSGEMKAQVHKILSRD